MVEMSRVSLGIAGLAGSLFLAYAIYFDRKRRSHPDFKKKLRERREQARKNVSAKQRSLDSLPNLQDHQAVQNYFLQQIQLGEELLANKQLDEGLEHFGRAVALCGQPQKLLEVLQMNMPANVFSLLLARLPDINRRIMEQQALLFVGDENDLE
ncbi:mitochondrial import receptor subunit TOM20 homolog [Arctopsyche grandis]|uniref:mitochondrial import receptor subunit TOM20 homolog n=1 Tax=Arctopsyche grandis TaxID=121162 RepID=UPI00406D6984